MACRLFRRLSGDLTVINGQQVRYGHMIRGKPPTVARTLEQRLAELEWKDPETSFRVDIGFKPKPLSRATITKDWIERIKKQRRDPEMENKARKAQLRIDLEKVTNDWKELSAHSDIKIIADHYGVFEHLFGDAYFLPIVPLKIDYDLGNNTFASVKRGNFLKPAETTKAPIINYSADPDSLWTLLLTTPDGNLVESEKEVCHWFIGNIPGSEITKGDLLVDYMRPIPARGIGYCRYIFVLYKQNRKINFSEYKKDSPCLSLHDRNWSTLDFYRKYQDDITPAGLSFFQADWDITLRDFYFDTLKMQLPVFEYDFPAPYIKPQKWFPKGQPFNLYLDKYRDPKDINRDFLMRKLKNVHPFKPDPPPLKFPNAHFFPHSMPSWLKTEKKKERLGWGRVNEIR